MDEQTVPPFGSSLAFCLKRTKQDLTRMAWPEWHRATSPLRRYSDLLVHQQLRAFISGAPLISEADMLARMSEAEQGGRNTSMAERLSNRHWTLLNMQQHPDKVYRGVVVDKRGDRGVIMLPELAIEVKMHGVGGYELDQELELTLASINLVELDFSCAIVWSVVWSLVTKKYGLFLRGYWLCGSSALIKRRGWSLAFCLKPTKQDAYALSFTCPSTFTSLS